jgi:hypothetical protein
LRVHRMDVVHRLKTRSTTGLIGQASAVAVDAGVLDAAVVDVMALFLG